MNFSICLDFKRRNIEYGPYLLAIFTSGREYLQKLFEIFKLALATLDLVDELKLCIFKFYLLY